jgi:C-terminal processing protease CtpA/Prc
MAAPLAAQGVDPGPDRTIDAAERRAVIEGVIARLKEAYVFPDTALVMERAIRARQRGGEYDKITSGKALADSLTSHLQAVSRDKHLRVRHSATTLPVAADNGAGPDSVERAQQHRFAQRLNAGFERVERLPGNVGYLELRSFGFDTGEVSAVAAAAFTFLANTDALIIDVRRNGGGSPFMVAQVASYLFGPEPVHLNSLYWRPGNRTDDFYTQRQVKGTRYGPDKPLYVLTSRNTFSGAEEFTYDLQTRKRATVVGDTTGGGAHPGGMQRVTDHFGVWVPTGRAINPITKTDWEHVGVRPDIAVPSDQALATAHLTALRALRTQATDDDQRRMIDRAIADLERGEDAKP